MIRRLPTILRSTFLAAAFSLTAFTACGGEHGGEWAIFPPSSPYVDEAGGRELIVPYYPGYCRPHDHGLFRLGRHGGMCGGFGMDWDMSFGGSNPGDYGIYTGAPRDEERLLHLGGNGPYAPSRNVPDFIDLYHGH